MASPERWLAYREAGSRARRRLFCFPYAGGGAAVYRGWVGALAAELEVCPVQLPGREGRLREAPFTRPAALVEALADSLAPLWGELPFAFFGHSMGAMLSFELARELRRRGEPQPLHLFASGRRAPHLPPRESDIHDLPQPEFIARLRELKGTPEEVLQHAELMKLLEPVLRADFAVNESYDFVAEPPFEFPISAFGGLADGEVTREDLTAWQVHTRAGFRLHMLPGDHFFLHAARPAIAAAMVRDLAEIPQAALPSR